MRGRGVREGGNAREPKHTKKRILRHTGGDPAISCRQKHVIIRHGQAAPPFEVLVKDFHHSGVQGNHAALTKLGARDLQNAVGQHVIESEVERLRRSRKLAQSSFRRFLVEAGTTGEADQQLARIARSPPVCRCKAGAGVAVREALRGTS
jgi:hypothetical protein